MTFTLLLCQDISLEKFIRFESIYIFKELREVQLVLGVIPTCTFKGKIYNLLWTAGYCIIN